MVLGENNESENQFPSFSRTGQAFFVDASDGKLFKIKFK